MATKVQIAAERIQNAALAAEVAAEVGLSYTHAIALLDMESEGRNFFGGDSGGQFKGETVTEAKYKTFLKAVLAGGPSNGVGPTQITYAGAKRADGTRNGGFFTQAAVQGLKLWEPGDNMRFGFKLLKSYVDRYPTDLVKVGRLYNGKESYGVTFKRVVGEWETRFKNATDEEAPVATWHLAPSLVQLQKDLDAEFGADRPNDGTIGDQAHAARSSEHNPDNDPDPMPHGAVSAIDVYTDANGKTWITDAEFDKLLAVLKKDARVWYVIHKGHIWSRTHNWAKTAYTGTNPHTTHVHISLMQTKGAHDSTASWKLKGLKGAKPTTPAEPKLTKLAAGVAPGKRHAQVVFLKRLLIAAGYAKNDITDPASTVYGKGTEDSVNRFHKANPKFASGAAYDGAIGPKGFEELQRQAPNVKG